MTTFLVSPTYPIPKREFDVFWILTQPNANFIRVWCTVAPDGSELDGKLKSAEAASARIMVYEGQGGGNDHPWRAKLDKGGTYTLVAQEYTKGTGFSGGYQGDTRANQVETQLGGEATLSLYVGKRLTSPMGTNADKATLVLWTWNDTIRRTLLGVHGEATPAVTAPTSPRATTAAKAVALTNALAALVDQVAATAKGDVGTGVANMLGNMVAHFADASHHANADSDNFIAPELSSSPTPQNLGTFVLAALKALRQHMQNDQGLGVGSAAAPYHTHGGSPVADQTNLPLVQGVGDVSDAYPALADLWRAYEAHRVSTAVHSSADNTHTLSALSLLLAVHKEFFVALAATTPTASPGDSTAAAVLKTWGFKEA